MHYVVGLLLGLFWLQSAFASGSSYLGSREKAVIMVKMGTLSGF